MNTGKKPHIEAASTPDQIDWECRDCSANFSGARPTRCPKCGSFVLGTAAKCCPEIEALMRGILQKLRRTAILVSERQHRKSRFIIGNLRRADEAVELALSALAVSGQANVTQTKTSGVLTPPR